MIFEVGCGVGNFMFPLLQEDNNIFIYACDFSKRAVQFVQVRRKKMADFGFTLIRQIVIQENLECNILGVYFYFLLKVNPIKNVVSLYPLPKNQ